MNLIVRMFWIRKIYNLFVSKTELVWYVIICPVKGINEKENGYGLII